MPAPANRATPAVVIVETKTRLRELVTARFEAGGFEVLYADSGEGALSMMRERDVQLALLAADARSCGPLFKAKTDDRTLDRVQVVIVGTTESAEAIFAVVAGAIERANKAAAAST